MLRKIIKNLRSNSKGEAAIYSMIAFAAFIILAIGVALPIIRSAILCGDIDGCIAKLEQNGYWVLAAGTCLSGDLQPCANDTYDLGDTTSAWRDLYISGDIEGNLIPSQNDTYDLGSPTRYWSHGYFGASSVHVGTIAVSDNGGRLQADGITLTRSYSLIIATSDAEVWEKAQADYILNGTDDYVEIQAALDSLDDFCSIRILGDIIYLGSTGITIEHDYCTFHSDAEMIWSGANGYAVDISNSSEMLRGLDIIIPRIRAAGAAQASVTTHGMRVKGVTYTPRIVCDFQHFNASSGLVIETDAGPPDLYTEYVNWYVTFHNCKGGIECIGDSSFYGHKFNRFAFSTTAGIANGYAVDVSAVTYPVKVWYFENFSCFPRDNAVNSMIKSGNNKMQDWKIEQMVVDALNFAGNTTLLDSVDDEAVEIIKLTEYNTAAGYQRRSSEGVYPVIHEISLGLTKDKGINEAVAEMMGRAYVMPLTNYIDGFDNLNGGSAYREGNTLFVNTSANANGQGCGYAKYAFDSNGYAGWNKKLIVDFGYTRITSEAATVGYVQIKSASAEGSLASHGLGVRADNLALKGVSYGTGGAEETVDLGVNMTSGKVYWVQIIFYPNDRIEWYVDGVLKATQDDTTKIPSTTTNTMLVVSVKQTAGSGVASKAAFVPGWSWREF